MFAKLLVAFLVLGMAGQWTSHFALSEQGRAQLASALMVSAGMMFVLGTCGTFAASFRRGLIDGATVWVAAGMEIGLLLLVAMAWPGGVSLSTTVLILGAIFLPAAPLAAAPLALTWNRHR